MTHVRRAARSRWRRGILSAGAGALLLAAAWVEAHIRISTDINWSEHVRPILREKCMSCHNPHGLARAVNLTIYGTDTTPGAWSWFKSIEEEVLTHRMPPWQADPRFERYANERRLTPEEIQIIKQWTEGGRPQGPLRNLPPPPEYAERDWILGTPDRVFELPEPHVIPADKSTDYVVARFPVSLEGDAWITGYEFFPGTPSIVHTMMAFIEDPAGLEPEAIEMEVQAQYDPLAPEAAAEPKRLRPMPVGRHFLGQWVRGDAPVLLPDEAGRKLREGSTIELRIWYAKLGMEDEGKPFTDQSRLGINLADQPVDILVESRQVTAPPFVVKAGEANHEVRASFTIEENARLLGLHPRLGWLGKDLRIQAIYPDGLVKPLLWIPKFNYRWLSSFHFEAPVPAPAGTVLEFVAHFDNSRDNWNNPYYPPKDVASGDGPFDQTFFAWVDYALEDHLIVATPTPTPRPEQPVASGMLVQGLLPDLDDLEETIDAKSFFEKLFAESDPAAAGSAESPAPPATPEARTYWCPMRTRPAGPGCEKDYAAPGRCETCNMEIVPKEDVLARYENQFAAAHTEWRLSREGQEEVYWCPNRGREDHEMKDYSAEGYCEVCGRRLVHRSRFERVRQYVDPADGKVYYGPGLSPTSLQPVQSAGHMDHNPVHGGLFIMADNLYHHLEALLVAPDEVRLFFYDDFKAPLDPRNFKGEIVIESFDETTETVTESVYRLSHERELDPHMTARIDPVTEFPVVIRARVILAGEPAIFDFPFDQLTPQVEEPIEPAPVFLHTHATYLPPSIPETVGEIVAEIRKREAALVEIIRTENWLAIHAPAYDTFHLVEALRGLRSGLSGRDQGRLLRAIAQLKTAADRLDRAGDARDAGRVGVRMRDYQQAVAELIALFPSP